MDGAGSVGPYFAIERWRPGAGWRRLDELVDTPEAMRERVATATATLCRLTGSADGPGSGGLEPRVVASTVFLGLAARLVAVPLGVVVLQGVAPRWTVADLWWQPVPGGPWPLAVGDGAATEPVGDLSGSGSLARATDALADLVGDVVEPVLRTVRDDFALSEQVLWGNVASALAGALLMLRSATPGRAVAATALVEAVLHRGRLAGTGDLVPSGPSDTESPEWSFTRRSCCLFYRVPGGGTCADCILTGSGPESGPESG